MQDTRTTGLTCRKLNDSSLTAGFR